MFDTLIFLIVGGECLIKRGVDKNFFLRYAGYPNMVKKHLYLIVIIKKHNFKAYLYHLYFFICNFMLKNMPFFDPKQSENGVYPFPQLGS